VSEWRERANCIGVDTSIFYPPSFEDSEDDKWTPAQAKEICSTCSVKGLCLEYSLENERYGVWGGKTERERIKLAAARGLKIQGVSPCGTTAAYARHRREGTPICDVCRWAHNEERRRAKELSRKLETS
jgi:WhiB family redox-sensing transcriptional regulator